MAHKLTEGYSVLLTFELHFHLFANLLGSLNIWFGFLLVLLLGLGHFLLAFLLLLALDSLLLFLRPAFLLCFLLCLLFVEDSEFEILLLAHELFHLGARQQNCKVEYNLRGLAAHHQEQHLFQLRSSLQAHQDAFLHCPHASPELAHPPLALPLPLLVSVLHDPLSGFLHDLLAGIGAVTALGEFIIGGGDGGRGLCGLGKDVEGSRGGGLLAQREEVD